MGDGGYLEGRRWKPLWASRGHIDMSAEDLLTDSQDGGAGKAALAQVGQCLIGLL